VCGGVLSLVGSASPWDLREREGRGSQIRKARARRRERGRTVDANHAVKDVIASVFAVDGDESRSMSTALSRFIVDDLSRFLVNQCYALSTAR
jgi:hypothetical protein